MMGATHSLCVGEHQRRAPPLLFDKQPWLDGFARHGLKFEDIDYEFQFLGI